MCGIAGHATRHGVTPDRSAVALATQALAHRGPDGYGIADFDQVSLGHRRLGIIDLTGSSQPWTSDDGRYTLAFNGEIYNYLELRGELQRLGYRFRSSGDTEVLLACFMREGTRCLNRLNGMFAFAVWDEQERQLTLARDRVGKKPLYFGDCGGGIAFASELHALTCFPGLADAVDPAAINDFFSYQYIPFERSIYRSIRKLLPAHVLIFRDGRTTIERYWSFPPPATNIPADAVDQLRDLVIDAVRLRMRSDVPVGAFLSGGIDSAIVVAMLSKLKIPVATYSIGFDHDTYDERAAARMSAEYYRVDHYDELFHLDLKLIHRLTRRFGEPFADVSALPAWHLCKHARQAVTVSLSGDGADELFAGYRRYLAGRWIRVYMHLPAALRRGFKATVDRLPDPESYFGRSRLKQIKLFLEFAERTTEDPSDCLPQTFSRKERLALLNPDTVEVKGHDVLGSLALEDFDVVERMLLADLAAYLPEDILTKVDRVSMDHALEVRSPFLDYRIVEFACRLPISSKIHGTRQKWILKRAFENDLPPHVLRAPKQGFAVPIGNILRRDFSDEFEQHVFAPTVGEYLNRREVERLWAEHRSAQRDHGLKLWTIFAFASWMHYRHSEITRMKT